MKLFWREHIPLILIYAIQMVLIAALYWAAPETHPYQIAVYGMVLSVVVLLIYLAYRYVSHKKLYSRLNEPFSSMDQALDDVGDTPLADAVTSLMQSQYQLYKEELYHDNQRLAYHTAFINRWVHQMKTPVSVIQLAVQDMDDEASDSIQEEVDRLKKGLEMALYTSRLDRYEHDFKVDEISLREAVQTAVAEHRRWFIRCQISPVIQIGEQVTVFTDAKWLQFMLGQLITNAVNYSAGVGNKVIFSTRVEDKSILLSVRDEGIGIEPEDLGRVFEPYFTGNQGRQYHESTGMGLYLVREVSERLGHEVGIESVPGQGTTVMIAFHQHE